MPIEQDMARIAAASEAQLEVSKKLLWEAQTSRKYQEVIRAAITAPILDGVQSFVDGRQLGFIETVEAIRDESLSFARFGDGELKSMLRPDYKLKFQENSPELAFALREVLTGGSSNDLLVGFPHAYRDLHWSGVWADIWGQLKPIAEKQQRFGNSHVTRPIFFQQTGDLGVKAWRSVWDGLGVKVATGKDSRFELIPELFDNLARATFMDSTPTNAFSDIPRLLDRLADDDADLILIALGPAGTVLASELAKTGKRALDVGHISDSYETVFRGGSWPESKPVIQP